MITRYFKTTDEDLKEAAELIRKGGLVAFPTETVYGLGADALNPSAAKDSYAAKGRPSDNPLIVHISDFEQVYDLAAEVPEAAKMLADAFWPGPLTMIFKKKPIVPDETTGGLDTVAVRLPDSEEARKLIRFAKTPVSGPSANTSGYVSPTSWQHVRDDLGGKIDGIIMGDPCSGGIESTVINLAGGGLQIFRPGLITPEMVERATGLPCTYDPAVTAGAKAIDMNLRPKAPGMKYKHYSPKAQLTLFDGTPAAVKSAIDDEAEKLRSEGKKVAVLFLNSCPESGCLDLETMIRDFYSDLRRCDEENIDVILAPVPAKDSELTFSLMNRMLKAAHYRVKKVN